MSGDDLPPHLRRAIERQHPGALARGQGRQRASKYGAQREVVDGINFDSKKEAARYRDLKLLRESGEVLYFLMQVPFCLPGNVKYRVDFLVFWADGRVTYEDVKGFRTEMYKLKRRQVQELYPVTIEEL